MLCTSEFWDQYITYRNHNLYLYGENCSIFNDILTTGHKIQTNSVVYYELNDIYVFSCKDIDTKQTQWIQIIQDIIQSPNYYTETPQIKLIVITSSELLKYTTQYKLKSMIDAYSMSAMFCFQSEKSTSIDSTIQGRCLSLRLPKRNVPTVVDDISFHKLRKLLRKPLTVTSITEIRELCYMRYLHSSKSESFQRMILTELGKNLYLPNPVKCDIVQDIAELNRMYQHCYRKPIFLETMIYSLFKHLEHYTYNL